MEEHPDGRGYLIICYVVSLRRLDGKMGINSTAHTLGQKVLLSRWKKKIEGPWKS